MSFIPTILRNNTNAARMIAMVGVFLIIVPSQAARPARPKAAASRNSWRGITPLRSTAADVAQALGIELGYEEETPVGPFKVEDGEVTFSYLTPSLAKIYRAPRSMVGKVFTIYFKPDAVMSRADLKLAADFKRCTEEMSRSYYYFVSSAGVAYQLRRSDDGLETIIYQPTRAEVQRLAVNTECVF